MARSIYLVSLVVHDYDEAIQFFVGKLGFVLVQDSATENGKRWVVVAPRKRGGCQLLLARAATEEQAAHIGSQTGGRVFLFLSTDDFWRDYNDYRSKGIEFIRGPKDESYGTVAVFKDLYGNFWDLFQAKEDTPNA
jgi:catechol 2,3-dioxygenase-like lactoylglutathione lyase family enzyme